MNHIPPDAFTPDAVTITPGRLRAILRTLAPAYERRRTIPILGSVRLLSDQTGGTATITNLDIEITVTSPDLAGPGDLRTCVPFATLQKLAATASAPLTVAVYRNASNPKAAPVDQIVLSDPSGFEARINEIYPVEDFPDFKISETAQGLTLSAATLRRLLRLSMNCISTEETRYYLNGIFLTRKPGAETLRAVATDGHRLAVVDCSEAWPDATSIILPRAAARAVVTMLDLGGDAPVNVTVGEHRATFTQGGTCIRAKLIDGKFPDYAKVIPTAEAKAAVTVSAAMLRRVGALMPKDEIMVRFSDGRLTAGQRRGDTVSIPAPVSGDIGPFAFNLHLLRDQARVTHEFRISGSTPGDPFILKAEDPDAFWLLMPMRW